MVGRMLVIGLVSVGVVLAGCDNRSSESEPVAWPSVADRIHAKAGSYTKTSTAELDGEKRIFITEWVVYDLDQAFIDRRIGLNDVAQAAELEEPTTKENPSLRFMYNGSRVVMWNPGVASACGTPWVDMSDAVSEQFAGLPLEDLLVIEPQQILDTARGESERVASDGDETVYELPIPAIATVPASALLEDPTLGERLEKQTLRARVTARDDEGPVEISVDVTSLSEATGPEVGDGTLVIRWEISPPEGEVDTSFPSNVADAECMS